MEYPFPNNVEAEIRLVHSHLLKRSDGIVEIRCADNISYDVEEIKENYYYLKEFAGLGKVGVLNFTEKYTLITHEARDYIAKGPHKGFVFAEVALIHSLPQRMLAQFYIKVFKPVVPAKYFSYDKKTEAEDWLLEFKQ